MGYCGVLLFFSLSPTDFPQIKATAKVVIIRTTYHWHVPGTERIFFLINEAQASNGGSFSVVRNPDLIERPPPQISNKSAELLIDPFPTKGAILGITRAEKSVLLLSRDWKEAVDAS